jgi:hypothetical protein
MGMTRAQMNKSVRQEALREQLRSQKHVEHVVDILEQIGDLDVDLDSAQVQRLKVVVDTKLKLITKYLPDLKSIEHSGDEENPLQVQIAAYELKFTDDPDP